MIREIRKAEISECVKVIRESFLTVADEFGFTPENAPRFTAFATTEERLDWQLTQEHRPMYAAFHDCGRMVGYYSLLLQENNECELNNLWCYSSIQAQRDRSTAFKVSKMFNRTKINIGIAEENAVLKRWYETFGFTHTGTKKFDFFPFTCGYMEKVL